MRNLHQKLVHVALAAALLLSMGVSLSSCQDKVDESDMYTFTGKTLYDYLNESENYNKYAYLLAKVPLSKRTKSTFAQLLTTRGNYTCFAPTNEALQQFLDSIYLTPNYDIAQTPDSMAEYIVRNSLIDNGDEEAYLSSTFQVGALDKTNMDNRYVTVAFDTLANGALAIMVNEKSRIVERDIEVSNGYIHGMGTVLQLSQAMLPALLGQVENTRIFGHLLELTGWDKHMQKYVDEEYEERYANQPAPDLDDNYVLKYPAHRYYGYTAFVEPDSVFMEKWGVPELDVQDGIVKNWTEVMEVIKTKCQEAYPNATATEMTDVDNAVNQFVAYHLLPERMTWENMIVHYSEYGYGYKFKSQLAVNCSEYYETFGPYRRLIKLTEGRDTEGRRCINRHTTYDRATYKELPTDRPGITVFENNGIYHNNALNGFYYPIDDILVYDDGVPGVVLNERLRWEIGALLPEMITNGYRRIKDSEQHSFPQTYFDNLKVSNESRVVYLPYYGKGLPNYQGDEFNVRGQYDLVFKLPPVPLEGTYELRWGAAMNETFGMAQLYFGNNPQNLQAIGLPIDFRLNPHSEAIGYKIDGKDEEANREVDKNMRIHGYMQPPKHNCIDKAGAVTTASMREGKDYPNNPRLRKIVWTGHVKPTDVYYLRIKSVLENTRLCTLLDYMEWCPKIIYNGVEEEDIW